MIRRLVLGLIWIYQRSFTLIGRGSCRYYPTCSEYTRQQFEQNPLLHAFYYSTKRILTCNQLFPGGIDYVEVAKLQPNPQNLTINRIKYWLVPKAGNRFYLIRNFSFKG
ncbi:MAG: membrane protein insertion efficiency factor YidD [Campylobacterales bacterium]|nr:membrane protein insertion efficiency factor YidD [Campylobacterales bacterium]